jgi:integrase
MVQDRRASESPIEHLKGLKVLKKDRRHDRRALEPDEVRRLLEVTRAAPERFGMTGHQRVMLYRLAIETGLRANELRSLKVSSFDLENCTVAVEDAFTKNK